METNTNSSPSTRPGFICRWGTALFTWRTARRLLIVVAMLATLIAIFYAEENWRGKRAWEQCKRDLAAKGELLDWAACIPTPIPDDENIIKAPKMAEWFIKPKPTGNWSNELNSKLNSGLFAEFARTRQLQQMAEVRIVSADDSNAPGGADLVLQHENGLLSVVRTNATASPSSETNSTGPPLIQIMDISLSEAIRLLAREAQLNYLLDPAVTTQWQGESGTPHGPRVSLRWENLGVYEAFFKLLHKSNLRWLEDPRTGIARIVPVKPEGPRISVEADVREQLRVLFADAMPLDSNGQPLISTIGAQTYKFVAESPWISRSVRVVVLSRGALRGQDVTEMLPPDFGMAGSAAGNGWRVEATASNSFHVFLGQERMYFAADYLAWSDQFAPECAQIREALQRPHLRMDDDYQRPFEVPIINFVNIRNIAQTAAQRAQCCLLLGRSEQAFHELSLIFDLRRLLAGKPTLLVAAMIDVAISGLCVETIADGFRLQAWREPELVALQEQLQQSNLLQSVAEAFRVERVAACHTFETTSAGEMAKLLSFGRPDEGIWKRVTNPVYLLLKCAPRGWVYLNLATTASLGQHSIEVFDSTRQLISPQNAKLAQREFEKLSHRRSPSTILAAIAAPNFIRASQTTARNQTRVNQALVVCGLERYRLAHGNYPEGLGALAPQFVAKLPHDVIGGQPLKYRRTDSGQFTLYSLGWNEQDNGGTPGKDSDTGDWVWPMETK